MAERYFKTLFEVAARQQGVTGENLLVGLESRLDNVVYRLGFGASRKQARQLVRHRHIEVNGRAVDVPSFQVRPGDEIKVREKSRDILPVQASLESKTRPTTVRWLAVDEGSRTGRMLERPTRDGHPAARCRSSSSSSCTRSNSDGDA